MNDVNDPPRDYFNEAQQIAAGQSRMLASREHVQALLTFVQSLQGNVQQMGQILAAILLDQLQPGQAPVMFIPTDMVESVKGRRTGVVIKATPQGLVVNLVEAGPLLRHVN